MQRLPARPQPRTPALCASVSIWVSSQQPGAPCVHSTRDRTLWSPRLASEGRWQGRDVSFHPPCRLPPAALCPQHPGIPLPSSEPAPHNRNAAPTRAPARQLPEQPRVTLPWPWDPGHLRDPLTEMFAFPHIHSTTYGIVGLRTGPAHHPGVQPVTVGSPLINQRPITSLGPQSRGGETQACRPDRPPTCFCK